MDVKDLAGYVEKINKIVTCASCEKDFTEILRASKISPKVFGRIRFLQNASRVRDFPEMLWG